MAEMNTPIEALRERLTQLLADWGAEMSMVLKDLEDARAQLAEAADESVNGREELEDLRRRVKGQDELIGTLKTEAAEAATLRKSLNESELAVEKLRSELESKSDLIKALRKETDRNDRLAADLKRNERELADQMVARKELENRLAAAEASLAENRDDTTELTAIRAELDAKAKVINSLRADAERSEQLEERLDEKRMTIATLETSLNSQAATIAELKASVKRWKEKYAAATSTEFSGDTSVSTQPNLPVVDGTSEADERDPEAEARTDEVAERTLAIDMRDALDEARDFCSKDDENKVAER